MRHFLRRLDYLCLEVLGKNIDKYSRTSKEGWSMRYCKDSGERLLFAYLANSESEGINENAYEFILKNFTVEKFNIFYTILKNINYYDFLNGKLFDELKISLEEAIKLREENQNFKLITKNMKLKLGNDSFIKSYKFFSNLYVEKKLNIFYYKQTTQAEMDNLLLNLLKNTSKNIENIKINLKPTKEFYEKSIEILNERKNLKSLFINFDEKVPKSMNIFFYNTFQIRQFPAPSDSKLSYINNEKLNESLKSFNSIEKLYFNFPIFKITNYTKEIFDFLQTLNLHNLKKVKINLCNKDYSGKELDNFFINYPNVEKLKVFAHWNVGLNIFNSILPCSSTVKYLKLNSVGILFHEQFLSFKTFLSHSSLQEIALHDICVDDQYSRGIFEQLEGLGDTLSSLTISNCEFADKTICLLPKVLQKCKNLKYFLIKPLIQTVDCLSEIFKSLQSSSQTLETIHVKGATELFEDCDLFNLLTKCEKLKIINLRILINNEKIPDLLSILKKFQNILEEINVSVCWNEKYLDELFDFLSGCSRLKRLIVDMEWTYEYSEEKLVKVLENSKYSLKRIFIGDVCSFHSLPYTLIC